MHQRQSIRKFKNPLNEKQIQKIIEAGVTAPSSLNSQPWSFIVIKDLEKKKKLRKIYTSARKKLGIYEQDTSFIENCTPIIVVCEDNDYGKILSCGMCIQNMFLSAESMGLGSLPSVTILQDTEAEKKLGELVGVKGTQKIVLVTFFGEKDEIPERKPKKDTENLIFENSL